MENIKSSMKFSKACLLFSIASLGVAPAANADQPLAQAFAKEQSKFTPDFPVFLWSAQPSSVPKRFAATVPSNGGSSDINWSLFDTNSEFRFAVAQAPLRLSIIPSENLKNNKTSNLGTTLLPQFEGGTLTVDQLKGKYTQDFTLPQDGTIDLNGYAPAFSGTFTGA